MTVKLQPSGSFSRYLDPLAKAPRGSAIAAARSVEPAGDTIRSWSYRLKGASPVSGSNLSRSYDGKVTTRKGEGLRGASRF